MESEAQDTSVVDPGPILSPLTLETILVELEKPVFQLRLKNPELLKEALCDLQSLVEMDEAKSMILSLIQYYLVVGELSEMNNIVLRGPPGVGKTQLGSVLAKIFNSLGILKKTDQPSSCVDESSCVSQKINKLNRKVGSLTRQIRDCANLTRQAYQVYESLDYDLQKNQRWYGKHSFRMIQLESALDRLQEQSNLPYSEPKDSGYRFQIASRENLIAGYLGQTALKTMELLESCRGGVLFIDEAYSLFTGDRDSYGMECLTTLNKFISEHPKEIIVIFGGYKDLLEETIFKAQPGLKRRVMWNFDINGYTPEGLSKIYQYQLQKEKWTVDPVVDLKSFFDEHKEKFEHYGGDTEKLCLQSKIQYSRSMFGQWRESGIRGDDRVIRKEHMDRAIDHLKKGKEDKMDHLPFMYM